MRPVCAFISSFVFLFTAFIVHADPLAPALLSLKETNSTVEIKWKTPLKRKPGTQMQPILPKNCQGISQPKSRTEGTGLLVFWQLDCKNESLIGKEISISEIASSGADVLLRIALRDGRVLQHILSGSNPSYIIPVAQSNWQVAWSYAELGTEHLLTGYDHVLFVLTLLLLVGWGRTLIWTITFFTLGHSITLALATLGYLSFPSLFAEILIALSIVFAAAELLRKTPSIMGRRPWVMSGGFGLLHGLGFAGALADVGLPDSDIPLALLSFNIGIEFGQLLVVTLTYVVARVLKNLTNLEVPWHHTAIAYSIGSIAAFWFWQRIAMF